MFRFDVFGHRIGVERRDGHWKPFALGNEGKRRDTDFVIPDDVDEAGLADYLAVLFHEAATPERNRVLRLE